MIRVDPPKSLTDRIARFEDQWSTYHAPSYNEASLRVDFLDALFGKDCLGWDVHNDSQVSERYKDVVVEEPVAIGGHTKRTDYVFRVGGTSKFIVEAKKPSVNVLTDADAAFQLRQYGWNKHLNLCVLTNFESFVVYDVRKPPKPTDGPNVGRVGAPLSYKELASKWEQLASIFSKDSVLKGRFDDEAEKVERQGDEPVDAYFLKQIESWRKDLATRLKLRNQELTQPELNFAVQAILDRIIFLRICEDRGVEPKGRLRACLSGRGVYSRLVELFRLADQRYNSGLFHFEAERGRASGEDRLTPHLVVEDEVLAGVLRDLYDSPYDFRHIPLEVLGQVYEQFLGKVIVVTDKRARVEPKPEVRKAGGVFYTPQYVVDYLVKNTLGRRLDGLTLEQAPNLKVLDPACGSGSFLLQAYQYLLDWYLDQYSKEPKKWKDRIVRTGSETFALSSKERCNILLTHLYGVDIDSQAVEVTKLALLLKALEKTPGEAIDRQLRLLHERALPDLDANIKRGNSIVDSDFYSVRQTTLLESASEHPVDVFPWEREFPSIFARPDPGFDVIIGNPPYIPIEMIGTAEKRYLESRHKELERKYDSSVIFLLAMLAKLRGSGRLGFISSVTWQTGENFARVRETLFRQFGLERLINLPYNVFKDAYVDTGVYSISATPTTEYGIYRYPKNEKRPNLDDVRFEIVPTSLIVGPEFKLVLDPAASALLSRLSSAPSTEPLGQLTISTQGLAAGRFAVSKQSLKGTTYPFLEGGQVYRYAFDPASVVNVDMSEHRSLIQHYEARPKILVRRVVSRDDRLLCAYFDRPMVFKKDINPFTVTDSRVAPMCLLGILNSRLMSYLYLNTSSIATKDDFRQTTLAELRRLPIRLPRPANRTDQDRCERIGSLSAQLQSLCGELASLRTEGERVTLRRRLDALDAQLEGEVSSLYSLAQEEIELVERGTKPAAWRSGLAAARAG
jgi:hypothetical protein